MDFDNYVLVQIEEEEQSGADKMQTFDKDETLLREKITLVALNLKSVHIH